MRKLIGLALTLFICIHGWSVNSPSVSITSIMNNNSYGSTTSKDSNLISKIHPWQVNSMVTNRVRTGDGGVTYQSNATYPEYKIWLPLVVNPPIYYISTTGSDANPGTLSQPWLTIQKAADTMVAGDTLIVTAGNYSSQRVSITHSGNSTSPITYQAQGNVVLHGGFAVKADFITIRGFEIADTPATNGLDSGGVGIGIYLVGHSCIIENNYIHDTTWNGIVIAITGRDPTKSTNCIIRGNRLSHNGQNGLEIYGQNHLVENNEIWGSEQYAPKATNPPDWVDADGMRFFGSGHIIRGNYIHDILFGPNGINPKIGDFNDNPHIDCFQTFDDGSHVVVQNVLFEQNFCDVLQIHNYSNSSVTGFMLSDGANNITIRNNIIRAFGGVNTGGTGNANHLYIYNNLWINNLSFKQWSPYALGLENAPYSIIKNNILYNQPFNTIFSRYDITGLQIDYNLAYNSDGTRPECVKWGNLNTCQPKPNHELWNLDPQFVNPSSGDYHLKSTSPAIDAGYNLGNLVPNDFDGVTRPQGAGYDIGPYELPTP